MADPTVRQKLLLRAIWDLSKENGMPPTFQEIADRMRAPGTGGIQKGLLALEKHGWLVRNHRGIRAMFVTVEGEYAAGIRKRPVPERDDSDEEDPPWAS